MMPTTEVVWQRHCAMNSRPKSLMEQGDENTDDQATMRIQYDQAEAKLAKAGPGAYDYLLDPVL